MAENVLKKQEALKIKQVRSRRFTRILSSMLDGTILTKERVESILPFFLFMAAIAILLIFNTYHAEKKARELEIMRAEIIELRLRYISTKSELMLLSNQSEVARRLSGRNIIESTTPPIYLNENKKGWLLIPRVASRNSNN